MTEGTIDKRRLKNGEIISLAKTINPEGNLSQIKDPRTGQGLHHSAYYIIGKENYISVQRKILEKLESRGISTILFKDIKNNFPKIIENNLGEKCFLTEKHFPLLIETITRKYATNDYLSRNNFLNEGQVLPMLTTEFLIYREKKKHILKSHGQNIYGLYDRDVFNYFLDQEVNLKNFIGENWKKTLDDMEDAASKIFKILEEIFGEELSEVEIEYSFQKNHHFNGYLKTSSFDLLISNIDIELKNRKDVSHKKGENSEDNERLNKNLLDLLNKKIL